MITEQNLEQAIAECQGERDPNANTCIRLAAFYTIRRELFGKKEQTEERADFAQSYSRADGPARDNTIDYDSGTEFSGAIDGRDAGEVWPIIDEMMGILQAMVPKLYDSVMRKLRE